MKEDTLDYREFSRLMRDWTRPLPWRLRRDMVRDLTLDVDQAQLADRISQIIAATISFALGVCLFLVSFLRFSLGTQAGAVADVVNYLSLFTHMEDFVRGVIDTRPLVFHLGLIGLLLFLNLKVVESRRWK